MSALDDAVAHFDPGPRARMCGFTADADAYDAAFAEVRALRDKLKRADAVAEAFSDHEPYNATHFRKCLALAAYLKDS